MKNEEMDAILLGHRCELLMSLGSFDQSGSE